MKITLSLLAILILLCTILLCTPAAAGAVGFRRVTVPDSNDKQSGHLFQIPRAGNPESSAFRFEKHLVSF
jgi:hypothetical protein